MSDDRMVTHWQDETCKRIQKTLRVTLPMVSVYTDGRQIFASIPTWSSGQITTSQAYSDDARNVAELLLLGLELTKSTWKAIE